MESPIETMVHRFLNWHLPEKWNPDGGVSFKRYSNENTPHQYENRPTGTNLLDAGQATEMVKWMVQGLVLDDEWHDIGTVSQSKDMFIWAYRTGNVNDKGEPEWSCGLGYWTVSGTWRDAYGHEAAVRLATHWARMPSPPATDASSVAGGAGAAMPASGGPRAR